MSIQTQPHLIYPDECYAIQGAVFEVYREMGCGFLEAVYQECLSRELQTRGIPHAMQPELRIQYKETVLDQWYQPDFICYDKIVLELKAVKHVAPVHEAQLLNYLRATNLKLGLLINFGDFPKATVKRLVL